MYVNIISWSILCVKLKSLNFILEAMEELKEFQQENDMIGFVFQKKTHWQLCEVGIGAVPGLRQGD